MPRNQQLRYGESSSRLLELKPTIDRIIADCRSDGGQLRSGLEILKNYQLDIMEELDKSEAGRGRDYYQSDYPDYPPYAPSYEMQRENSRLLNNLKAEVNRSNHLAGNVEKIENKIRKLRAQVDEREEDEYYDEYPEYDYPAGGRSNVHHGYYEDQPRGYDRGPAYYPARQRGQAYDSSSDSQSKDDLIRSLLAQNNRLKGLVRELQARLEDTEIKLRRAQERSGFSNIRQQLQNLKRENEQLRQHTIRLLSEKNTVGSGSNETHWRRQFQHLQEQMQNQNRLKFEFLQELTKFKGRYKQCEDQKKQLQQELNRVKGYNQSPPRQRFRVQQRVEYEERGNIDKYKNLLEEMRNKY